LTFVDSPEMFINLINEFSPIYNKKNIELSVEKETSKLKIKTKKLKE